MAGRKIRGPGVMGSIGAMKKSLKGKSGAGQFKLITAESSFSVRFLTEPDQWFGYYEHYDTTEGFFPCYGGDCCTNAENKAAMRYLGNVWSADENKVMALKIPKSLAESLLRRQEKFSTLQDRWYEVSRTGTGKTDTVYSADPDSPTRWTPPRGLKLLNLESLLQSMVEEREEDEESDPEYEPPTPSRKSRPAKTSSRRVMDDEYEDDDEDEEDEEEEEYTPRPARRVAAKKTIAKKAIVAKKTVAVKKPVAKTAIKRTTSSIKRTPRR
jgi:hypothetical protein